jgi:predicted nucleic acid-binding protein
MVQLRAAALIHCPIAAIAIANGLPLYTCNSGDFREMSDPVVREVPHPDR